MRVEEKKTIRKVGISNEWTDCHQAPAVTRKANKPHTQFRERERERESSEVK